MLLIRVIKVGWQGDLIFQVTPMFIVWGILGYLGGKARFCGEVCVASVWLSLIVCAVNQFAYTCGLQGRLKQESGSFP